MGDEHAGGTPPKKKGGAGKTLLTCCCLFFVVMALIGAGVLFAIGQAVSFDPATVAARLPNILPASVPAGYSGLLYMRIPVYDVGMAVIGPAGTNMQQGGIQPDQIDLAIVIIDPPPGTKLDDPADVKKELAAAQRHQGGDKLQVEADDAGAAPALRLVKVRGEDCPLHEVVTKDRSGAQLKQVVIIVPQAKGSAEKVGILAMGKAETFDQAALDAFLASIQ